MSKAYYDKAPESNHHEYSPFAFLYIYTSMLCTLCIVHYTLYSVQCTMYSVQCTVYNVYCTLYNVQCTKLSNVYFTVGSFDTRVWY